MPFPIEVIMATKQIRAALGFSEIEEDLIRGDYSNLERMISDIYYLVEQEAAVDPFPGLDYNSFVRSSGLDVDEEKFKIALQLKHRQQVATFNVHDRSSLTEVPDRFDRKDVVQFIFT